MSDYIPFEIQVEVIKRLPVKSLLQVRLVSTSWKAFIDSPEFVSGIRHTQPPRMLMRFHDLAYGQERYVSFLDDNRFIPERYPLTVPVLSRRLWGSRVLGSCHGLLCSYGFYLDPIAPEFISVKAMAVLWNPSIRKSVGIVVSDDLDHQLETVVGFGVCPIISDPMIVKVSYISMPWEMTTCTFPWQVSVFKLSSGTWSVPSSNMPSGTIRLTWSQVVLDRFIYWSGYEIQVTPNVGYSGKRLIMSFDMTSEEFEVVGLPDCLTHIDLNLSISKLWESLVVMNYKMNDRGQTCDLWFMVDHATKYFIRAFTISSSDALITTLGCRNSGEVIIAVRDDHDDSTTIEVYQRSCAHFHGLKCYGRYGSFFLSSYMETLLLLNQRDGCIYSI